LDGHHRAPNQEDHGTANADREDLPWLNVATPFPQNLECCATIDESVSQILQPSVNKSIASVSRLDAVFVVMDWWIDGS
jgi:hypothetical protein